MDYTEPKGIHPRLTIRANGVVVLKVPKGLTPPNAERIVRFAEYVVAQVGIPKATLRGAIKKNDAGAYVVCMCFSDNTSMGTFKEVVN